MKAEDKRIVRVYTFDIFNKEDILIDQVTHITSLYETGENKDKNTTKIFTNYDVTLKKKYPNIYNR